MYCLYVAFGAPKKALFFLPLRAYSELLYDGLVYVYVDMRQNIHNTYILPVWQNVGRTLLRRGEKFL